MNKLALAGTAAALLVAGISPSMAAKPRPPQIVDLAGDANGLNGQDLALPIPSVSTAPASVAAADILSVAFKTIYKIKHSRRVPNGFTVTMTLSAAAMTGVDYNVTATVPATCDGANTMLNLTYEDMGGIKNNFANCVDSSGLTSTSLGTAELDPAAHTITWTVFAPLKKGAVVDNLNASTSVFVLGVFDEATGGTSTFVIGQ